MKHESCGNNGWYENGEQKFKRVSRWITIRHNYTPNKRNALWDYVQDENGYKPYQDNFSPENGLYLDYFRFNGRNYAIEQFGCLGNPFWFPDTYRYTDKPGKAYYLSGIDMDNYYNPLYIEFDEYMEKVRVHKYTLLLQALFKT